MPNAAQVQKIADVVILVGDVDAVIEFYCGKLGLTKRTDIPSAASTGRSCPHLGAPTR